MPLRIFEQRYLDMISRCLKEDRPFGVLQIRDGTETGPALTYDVGTLAQITDWYQGSDGLLGITATGLARFRRLSGRRQADGLQIGTIERLPEHEAVPLPARYRPLAAILAGVIDDLGKLYEGLERRYDDAGWVSYRFAEILPLSPEQKQACLETDDPVLRLESMQAVLDAVR